MNLTSDSIEKNVLAAKAFIEEKTRLRPKFGIILGSGLSGLAHLIKADISLPFADIPYFHAPGVEGHPGRLIIGHLGKTPVAALQGRLHAYEGHSFNEVMFPTRTLAKIGVETLLVTNAAGGLKKTMRPGDFMVITDHINLIGDNPLRGPNWAAGPRFVDMTEAYDRKLSAQLKRALQKARAKVHQGVYVGVMGPSYETAAEIRFYAKIGGSAVGMSTVADVLAAKHLGLKVVGVSCITNLGTGLSKTPLSHDEVKEIAQKVESKFSAAILAFAQI